ncbi:MAG: hypothetical protein J5J00_04895 [Deltaproteobacteria bacterium]|nr:hypothetical protein [Deltaproteobacteria bacterium]
MSPTNASGTTPGTTNPSTATNPASELSQAEGPKSFIELSTGLHLLGGLRDDLSLHSLLPAWHLGIHGVGIGANEAHLPHRTPATFSERTPGSFKHYSAGQLAIKALKAALAATPEGAPLEETINAGNRSVAEIFERFGVKAERPELLPGASAAFVRIPRQAATSGEPAGELQVVAWGAGAVLIEFKQAPPCIITDGYDRLITQPDGFLVMNGTKDFEREAAGKIMSFPLSEIRSAFAFSQNLMLPNEMVDRNRFAERLIGYKNGSRTGDPRDSWTGALYADSRQRGYKDCAYEASIYGWQFR